MVLLLFQLLFLLILLVINGEPLRVVLLSRFRLFSDLDLVQICILNVYVGGLILYAIVILPFGLFSWEVAVGFTLLNAVLSMIIHFKTLIHGANPSRLKLFMAANKKVLLTYLAVFMMLIVFLTVNLSSVSGLVFGSVRDESIHSLDVQVILENHSIPLTLTPYLSEGIIYPQAAHVIFAFAAYMLSWDVPQIVFYVTILFKSLTVFGAYFLGRKLGSNITYSLGLAFAFAFISSWPLYVVWGGNPFLVGFPFFLVCLGLLFSFVRSRENHKVADLVALGLLIGYAGTIIISYIETLIMVMFLIFIYYLIQNRSATSRIFQKFAIVFGVSLLPLSPFLLRFVEFYQYTAHNIGVAYDFVGWTGQQLYLSQALQWAYDNLSPYFLPKVLTLVLLFTLPLLLWISREYKKAKPIIAFALGVLATATFLSFVSFFLSADLTIISWGHQGLLISIPIGILMLVSFVKIAELLREGKIKRLSRFFPNGSLAALLLAVIILSALSSPFIYYRLVTDSKVLRGSYDMFAVTSENDYELMTWMKTNLRSDAVVLVHPYGSGLFIPSISHHKIIFPYSGSSLSSSYQTLVGLLENDTLNADAYQIMASWNVSHVFVGTTVAYWMFGNPRWDPKLFLGNPNFKLVKNIGSSYLFEPNKYNENVSFLENFDLLPWHQYGWRNEFSGIGRGNVALSANNGVNDSNSLSMTAQATQSSEPTVAKSELNYTNWIEREIFVPNNRDVTLSFYLGAMEGFNGNDTFALLVYNMQRSQAIVITTPNGIHLSYPSVATLDGHKALLSFDLSKIWREEFNSSFPRAFVLQFANYDFDGIPNVAYLDSITVTSTPISYP